MLGNFQIPSAASIPPRMNIPLRKYLAVVCNGSLIIGAVYIVSFVVGKIISFEYLGPEQAEDETVHLQHYSQ